MQIIQASDTAKIHLTKAHLIKFNELRVLSLEGVKQSSLPTITLYSDTFEVLTKLQYLALKNVKLLDEPTNSDEIVFSETAVNDNLSNNIYYVPEKLEDIVPYEEFKQMQRTKIKEWKGFVPLKNLEFLLINHCQLPEAFSRSHSGAFMALKHLKKLTIRSSQLRVKLEIGPDDLKEIESLSLPDNDLLDLQSDDLQGMDSLHNLDLSGNQFTRLTENTFPLMPDLETLDLRDNPLKTVYSKAFIKVPSIRRLILGSFRWDRDDVMAKTAASVEFKADSFSGLAKLRELWIGPGHPEGNGINSLYFQDLVSLTELRLRGQCVSIEADSFSANRRLQILDLKQCHLQRLSVDAFQSLNKLRTLDLSTNELYQLPAGVFDPLISLKELWLDGNRLVSIPADVFITLTTTKLIRLENNPWHCSCQLDQLKATVVNKVVIFDASTNRTTYQYDRKVAPLCVTPESFKGEAIFDVMRKSLRCSKVKRLNKDKPEFLRIDVWNKPTEIIDHGLEVIEQESEGVESLVLATAEALDHRTDIIDHGEEVVENIDTSFSSGKAILSKSPNDVLTETNVPMAEQSISKLKSISLHNFPNISKKSLKLAMENSLKKGFTQ